MWAQGSLMHNTCVHFGHNVPRGKGVSGHLRSATRESEFHTQNAAQELVDVMPLEKLLAPVVGRHGRLATRVAIQTIIATPSIGQCSNVDLKEEESLFSEQLLEKNVKKLFTDRVQEVVMTNME